MIGPEKERHPCLLPHLLGNRARLNARVGPGALSAGRAGKMAARRHELGGMQKKGPGTRGGMLPGRRRCSSIGRLDRIWLARFSGRRQKRRKEANDGNG